MNLALYHKMADRAFVIAKEVFYRRDGNILTLWEWFNDEKQFFWFKFNYINKHLYRDLEKNFKHLTMRNTDPCNFLTKLALVSKPSTVVVAKDSSISYYLNLSIPLHTIVILII